MKALALVRIAGPAAPQKVMREIQKVKGVETAFPVFGRFDAVAVLSAESLEKLKESVLKIRAIEGVRKTETLVQV
ncbi:MAG: Lrp/AsnC ligand binding domain-containing protein [Candidatus Brockarchaeota archaeon]|nr:Lrp/AsnC ligand binding domain-containing protein [Candidatus Brockarchaeota archaeon]